MLRGRRFTWLLCHPCHSIWKLRFPFFGAPVTNAAVMPYCVSVICSLRCQEGSMRLATELRLTFSPRLSFFQGYRWILEPPRGHCPQPERCPHVFPSLVRSFLFASNVSQFGLPPTFLSVCMVWEQIRIVSLCRPIKNLLCLLFPALTGYLSLKLSISSQLQLKGWFPQDLRPRGKPANQCELALTLSHAEPACGGTVAFTVPITKLYYFPSTAPTNCMVSE